MSNSDDDQYIVAPIGKLSTIDTLSSFRSLCFSEIYSLNHSILLYNQSFGVSRDRKKASSRR